MTTATLTPRQTRFIDEILVDGNGAAAAVRAGYAAASAKVRACRLTKDNRIQAALQARQAADSARLNLDRQRVLEGLLEAIGQAREKREPMAMIRGWAEIGKMMGFYAAETKNVHLDATVSVTEAQMSAMSDRQLAAIIEAGRE
jgi:phage terminase small subunit